MSPSSLPDRKYSWKFCLPCTDVGRGVRKPGESGWEDQLEKSLEAHIEAESVITDKKALRCF